MLEKIKGQEITIRMLKGELQKDALPQTLLFFGPDGSGKFLTAIEIARILNCETGNSTDKCSCPSCVRIKNLSSENLYVIERSNLKNTFDIWKLSGVNKENIHYFIFDLKRIIYLLHEPKGSGSEKTESEDSGRRKRQKFESERRYFEEIIREPEKIIENQEHLFEMIDQLLSSYRSYIIVIEHIKEIQRFLSIKSSTGKPRVAIINGAENMNEEASNRLLKTSEEPPKNTYIILITKNLDLLRETVRSRCFRYKFRPIETSILKEIVKRKTGYAPSEEELKGDSIKRKLKEIYNGLFSEKGKFDKQYQIIEQILSAELTVNFLYYIIERSREEVLNISEKNIYRIYTLETIIKEAARIINGIQHGNLNPETSLIDFTLNYLAPNM